MLLIHGSLETLAEDLRLAISGWGAEAWGTGVLRLGEALGHGPGSPAGSQETPGL